MSNKIAFNANYPDITKSDELYERAIKIMHPVTQTLAKGPGQFMKGVAPKYIKRGKDAHVWDVDGNEFIDFNMGIGPISLGYCYDKVDQAIIAQLKDGITFSLMHELEVELAELVHKIIPNAESIRISKQVRMYVVRLCALRVRLQDVIEYCVAGITDGTTGTSVSPAAIKEFLRK